MADTQNNWEVLGIERTEDDERIRQAYLALLPNFHPEEDPEGFRKLREAYEGALEEARREREKDQPPSEADEKYQELMGNTGEPQETTPEGRAIAEMIAVLEDFRSRLDLEKWREILDKPEYGGLDMQAIIGDRWLTVLMRDYYIPQRVWQFFNERFDWIDQESRLKQDFPPDYIEYVYNGIRYEKVIRDEYFDLSNPDTDFQAFIDRYYETERLLNEGDVEGAGKLLEQSTGAVYDHPDFQLLRVRYERQLENFEKGLALAQELHEKYPDDLRVAYTLGQMLVFNERSEESLPFFRAVLAETPNHYNARVGVVRALFDLERYEEAKAEALDMLVEYRFDGYLNALFHAASEKLIPIYQAQLEQEPGNQDILYKLASCLFNEGKYGEVRNLIERVTPNEEHRAKHAELLFDTILDEEQEFEQKKADGTLEKLLREWEDTETNRMRLRNLPDKYRVIGLDDIALEKAEIYLREFPKDPEILTAAAGIRRARGDGAGAWQNVREGLESNDSHPGLLREAALLFDADGNYADAARSAESSLAAFPYQADLRELLMRIYYRAGQTARVSELAQESEEYEIQTPMIRAYGAAAQLSPETQQAAEAEAAGAEAAEEKEKKTLQAIETLFGVLDEDPKNLFALETLGDYYTNQNMPKEAFNYFDRLIAIEPAPYYYLSRGWLYANYSEQFGQDAIPRAREDYAKAVEIDPGYAPAHYQLGYLAFYDGRMKDAAAHFERTLELASDFRGSHYFLSIALSELGQPERAAAVADDGIEIFAQRRQAAEEEGNQETAAQLAGTIRTLRNLKYDAWNSNHHYEEAAAAAEELEGLGAPNGEPGDEGLIDALTGETAQPPEDTEARAERARRIADVATTHVEVHQDERAGREIGEALALAPQDAEVFLQQAFYLRVALRDYAGAAAAYGRAFALRGDARTQMRMAKALAEAGRLSEAKRAFKAALKNAKKGKSGYDPPGTPCNDYVIGECYLGLGDLKKAEPHLLRAMEGAKGYDNCVKRACFEAAFALALLYRARGDQARAREYYQRVRETVPDREYAEAESFFV